MNTYVTVTLVRPNRPKFLRKFSNSFQTFSEECPVFLMELINKNLGSYKKKHWYKVDRV